MIVNELPTAVARHGRLAIGDHGKMIDRNGATVVLRGVSLFWSQWLPQFYNRLVVQWLCEDWKINVIRIPVGVHHGGYLENPGCEMAKLRTVVEAAIEFGIYAVIDWHSHELELEGARKFFCEVVSEYGGCPNLIYEIWNEPHGSYSWDGDIMPYHLALVPEIRARDPLALVVVGTERWCRRLTPVMANPLPFSNVAYALHVYTASHGSPYRTMAADFVEQGLPLVVSEWGASNASGGGRFDAVETRLWLDFFDAHELSQMNWSIATKMETSAALLPGASPFGGWPAGALSRSGTVVREHIRCWNGRMDSPNANA